MTRIGGRQGRQHFINGFKSHGCIVCGWVPETLGELHLLALGHKDRKDKFHWLKYSMSGNPVDGIHGSRTLAETFEEFKKCEVVCDPRTGRDCHRQRELFLIRERSGEIPLPLQEWIQETTSEW